MRWRKVAADGTPVRPMVAVDAIAALALDRLEVATTLDQQADVTGD